MTDAETKDYAESQEGRRLPALWPYLLVCAAAALWIDLGSLHRSQHSDSLLPALISLYRWMPFYWDLDRIGMLGPLIARPVKHPLFNLLLQDGLYLFCGLSSLFLLPRYLLRNATFPIAGMLSVAAFVALTPDYYRFEYFIDTQYGVWLFLGLSSLILLESAAADRALAPRRIAAIGLMILAHWAYCTATMFLGPLIVFRALCFWPKPRRADILVRPVRASALLSNSQAHASRARLRRTLDAVLHSEFGLSLTVLAIGFCTGLGLMRLAPTHDTDFASLAVNEWPATWGRLAVSTWSALAPQWWPWALLAAAAIGIAACCVADLRKEAATNARAAAAAIAAATLVGLFIGTRHWVVANGYAFRFLLPSALMVQAALLGVAVAPLAHLIRNPKSYRFGAVALLLVVGAAAFSYGRPSLAGVYRDLDPYYYAESNGIPPGISTRELLAHDCTHVAGNYWTVWHSVFRANLALYERGERRTVWGGRSVPRVLSVGAAGRGRRTRDAVAVAAR
jgi:hypothetical protein